MALTREKIIDKLVSECGLKRREATDLYDTFIQDIKDAVNAGDRALLPGFGQLRFRRQPYKLKRADIPEEDRPKWSVVHFTPSSMLMKRIQRALIEESRDVD